MREKKLDVDFFMSSGWVRKIVAETESCNG